MTKAASDRLHRNTCGEHLGGRQVPEAVDPEPSQADRFRTRVK